MPLPRTYKEIEEMVKRRVLHTKTARSIVRKAGVKPGDFTETTGLGSQSLPILSVTGSATISSPCCLAPIKLFAGNPMQFALLSGWVEGWGRSSNNQAGQETFTEDTFSVPTRLMNIPTNVQMIHTTGFGSVLLKDDSSVWITARPATPSGGFDPGHAFERAEELPLSIAQIESNQRAAGEGNFFALSDDGTVWAMGDELPGLGPGAPSPWVSADLARHEFVQMPTSRVSGVVDICTDSERLVIRRSDDSVASWGFNSELPTEVTDSLPDPIAKMRCAAGTVLVLTEAGEIYASGGNSLGEYGNGTQSATLSYALWHKTDGVGSPYTDVMGADFGCFAIAGGRLYSWGQGGARSGRGTSAPEVHSPAEITVGSVETWISLHGHCDAISPMAIAEDGCTYIWGGFSGPLLGQGVSGFSQLGSPTKLFTECLGPGPNPPWPAYGNCAIGPHTGDLADLTEAEVKQFYNDAFAAENGDPDALGKMRDWVIRFKGEDEIVINHIMPRLRYDWDPSDVYTTTLAEDNRCTLEVDIAPPIDDGFWEQYKYGDERFRYPTNGSVRHGILLTENQDYRLLVKDIVMRTGKATEHVPAVKSLEGGSATCNDGDGSGDYTHVVDAIHTSGLDYAHDGYMTVYRLKVGAREAVNNPRVVITNDTLRENIVFPFYPPSTFGPLLGTGLYDTGVYDPEPIFPSPDGLAIIPIGTTDPIIYVDEYARACTASPRQMIFSQDHYCSLIPEPLTDLPANGTDTFLDFMPWKDAPSGRKNVDWSVDPTPGSFIERYNHSWPTFDVVAVRINTGG